MSKVQGAARRTNVSSEEKQATGECDPRGLGCRQVKASEHQCTGGAQAWSCGSHFALDPCLRLKRGA